MRVALQESWKTGGQKRLDAFAVFVANGCDPAKSEARLTQTATKTHTSGVEAEFLTLGVCRGHMQKDRFTKGMGKQLPRVLANIYVCMVRNLKTCLADICALLLCHPMCVSSFTCCRPMRQPWMSATILNYMHVIHISVSSGNVVSYACQLRSSAI